MIYTYTMLSLGLGFLAMAFVYGIMELFSLLGLAISNRMGKRLR